MMALITSDSGQTDGGGGQVRCIGDDMLSTPIWIPWIIVLTAPFVDMLCAGGADGDGRQLFDWQWPLCRL